MPLSYRDVLDRYERSKAFGDPRDFNTFSQELEQLHPGEGYGQASRAGWWQKASTALDRSLFEPIAEYTTAPVGEAIGGLFGDRGAEIGRHVGQSLPRMLAQTLPLTAAEIFSGGAATPLVLGALGTGALFGAQTLGEGGTGKQALLSGVTAAALPGVGRLAGNIALRTIGPEVERTALGLLPKAAEDVGRFKATKLLGSQVGQIGTLQTSQYLADREHYDPLSAEFWAQQIPFTIADIVGTARARIPSTSELPKAAETKVQPKSYVVPPSTEEENAQVQAAIEQLTRKVQDETTTPMDKDAALAATIATVQNPKDAITVKREAKALESPMVTITGKMKLHENGNAKVLVLNSEGVEVPEHGNLWVNQNPAMDAKMNGDGTFTIRTPAKFVSKNVQSPLSEKDFGVVRDTAQPDLPVVNPGGTFEWEKPEYRGLAPDEQRTLERHAVLLDKPTTRYEGETQKVNSGIHPLEGKNFLLGGVPTDGFGVALKLKDGRYLSVEGRSFHGELVTALDHLKISDQDIVDSGFWENGKFESGGDLAENLEPAKQEMATEKNPEFWWRDKVGTADKEFSLKPVAQAIEQTEGTIGTVKEKIAAVPTTPEEIPNLLEGELHTANITDEFGRLQSLQNPTYNPLGLQAALKNPDGSVITGRTHGEIVDRIQPGNIAGFVTREGKFLTREEAHLEVTKAKIQQSIDSGASPTQAVEKARLSTQTPEAEKALTQLNVLRQQAKLLAEGATFSGTKASSLLDEKGKRITFKTQEEAEAFHAEYQKAHPESVPLRVTPRGEGDQRHFFFRLAPQEFSLEGSRAEGVLPADPIPVDTRPTPSKQRVLDNLSVAEREPRAFAEYYDEDLIPDEPVDAARKARLTLQFGEQGLDKVNDVLRQADLIPFRNATDMKTQMVELMRAADEFNKKYSNFTLDSERPYDSELVRKIGVHDAEGKFDPTSLPKIIDWYVSHPESGLHGQLVDAVRKSGVSRPEDIKLSFDEHEGPAYFRGDRRINIDFLPTDEADALFWARHVVAHEYVHDSLREMYNRSDPAAVKLRSTLTTALDALRNSPEIPAKVRSALHKAEQWMVEFRDSTDADRGVKFLEKFDNEVGKEHREWGHVLYGLSNEEELLAGLFSFPKLIEVASRTKLPRTPTQTVLQWLSKVWNGLFGGKTETDNVLAEVLQRYDNYLSGKTVPRTVEKGDPNIGAWSFTTYKPDDIKVTVTKPLESDKEPRIDPYGDVPTIVHKGEKYRVTLFSKSADSWDPTDHTFANANTVNDAVANIARILVEKGVTKGNIDDLVSTKTGFKAANVQRLYNARDYIRDSLIAEGVRPDALASRLSTVERLYATGDLNESITGFEREANAGTLPATAEVGKANDVVRTALATGDSKSVYDGTMNLLADEVPAHMELLQRMKEDVKIARELHGNIRDGLVPGEMPTELVPRLKLAQAKLTSMEKALRKYSLAIDRLANLDNFQHEGFEDTQARQLVQRNLPSVPDKTGVEDEAYRLLGLADYRREAAEKAMTGKDLGFFTKNLMLTQYVKKLFPAFRPVADHVRLAMAKAIERITALNLSYSWNSTTKELDKKIYKNNYRVAQNESLANAASDIYRYANVKEAAGEKWSFDDDLPKKILSRFNQADRDAILLEHNSQRQRHLAWTETVLPQALSEVNHEYTAKVIAAHEGGMLPDNARELAQGMYTAIQWSQDPAMAQAGAESLKQIASKMQPKTFIAALQNAQDNVQQGNKFLEFMRKRPSYVSEQRFDKYHLVMRGPNGEAFRASKGSREELQTIRQRKEAEGYTFLDFPDKDNANVPTGGVRSDVMEALRELDVQSYNRLEAALKSAPPEVVAIVLPETQRAAQYAASAEAFRPTPGVSRRFVAGREYINMIENADEFYVRANNWLRHRLTRASTSLDMMHPELAGSRSLTAFSQQHVQNSLTPDNAAFRKLVEGTYFYRLAFSFGNSLLESMQTLGTGMQAMIAETGSVTDAAKLLIRASKEVWTHNVTRKWSPTLQSDMDKAAHLGLTQMTLWSDIVDPDRDAAMTVLGRGQGLSQGVDTLRYSARKFATLFQRYNDRVGIVAGLLLAKDRGMVGDEAFNFAWDMKEQGLYSGGKAQRPVGLWSIKTKPVPQMLSSLQTYTLGWFSQMATDWKVGFGGVGEFTPLQRTGAKKAFLYGLGAQAVLAGALGLPGVGQGLALMKQATGVDLKGKLRASLAGFFGEDQDSGGMLTNLALRGGLAGISPIDPSNRAAISVPFVGVDPYKGFDIGALLGAPGSTVSDAVQGFLGMLRGDTQAAAKILPSVARPAVTLFTGEGDVRDKRGALLYKLSPAERFATAIGLPPSRIQAARDTAEAVKNLNDAAQRHRDGFVDSLAKLTRQGDLQEVHRQLLEYHKDNPDVDVRGLIRGIAGRVEAQTVPYDYRRNLNVGADIAGLGSRMPSTEVERQNVRSGVESSLGLMSPPNLRGRQRAVMLDDLMNSNPYLSRAAAVAQLSARLPSQRRGILQVPPEYQ